MKRQFLLPLLVLLLVPLSLRAEVISNTITTNYQQSVNSNMQMTPMKTKTDMEFSCTYKISGASAFDARTKRMFNPSTYQYDLLPTEEVLGLVTLSDLIVVEITTQSANIPDEKVNISYRVDEVYLDGDDKKEETRMEGEKEERTAKFTFAVRDLVKGPATDTCAVFIYINMDSRVSEMSSPDPRYPNLKVTKTTSAGVKIELCLIVDIKGSVIDETTHVIEDNKATDEKNTTMEFLIPAVIAAVLTGVLTNYLRKKKKKQKKEEPKDEPADDSDPEEDEEEEPDDLRMDFYKAFGDTLVAGDAAQMVSACIVRMPKKGPEYVDESLTNQIEIKSGDDYLVVEDNGMVNGWKTAYVSAPECEGDTTPDEGIVVFRIANEQASYTNRMHFRVEKGGILFDPEQPSVAIPARYDQVVEVPFTVQGIPLNEVTEVTATVTDQNGKEAREYSVRVLPCDEDRDEPFYVEITDELQDEKKDDGTPGTHVSFVLHIEARNKEGFTVKGDLPLFRFYMGLHVQLGDSGIGCYVEEYDPMKHESHTWFKGDDGKQYVYSQNRCWVTIYDYDPETHRIVETHPSPMPDVYVHDDNKTSSADTFVFNVEPLLSSGAASGGRSEESVKTILENIGLKLLGTRLGNDNFRYFISCTRGKVTPPTRLAVKLSLTVTLAKIKKTYHWEDAVMLWSQPRRKDLTPEAWEALKKKDAQLEEQLLKVREKITEMGLSDDFNLFLIDLSSGSQNIRLSNQLSFFGVQRFQQLESGVDLLLRTYDINFGYDEETVTGVVGLFKNYLAKRQVEYLRQQDEAYAQMAEAMKDAGFKEWVHDRNMAFKQLGIVDNIVLGFLTCGAFDVMQLAVSVADGMYQEAEQGKGDYSFLSMWSSIVYAGSKEATISYLREKGMKVVASAGVGLVKGAGKFWNVTTLHKRYGLNPGKEMVMGGRAWKYEIQKSLQKSLNEIKDEVANDVSVFSTKLGDKIANLWKGGKSIVPAKAAGEVAEAMSKNAVNAPERIKRCLTTFTDMADKYRNAVNMVDDVLYKAKVKANELTGGFGKKQQQSNPFDQETDKLTSKNQADLDAQGGGQFDNAYNAAVDDARQKIAELKQLQQELGDVLKGPEAKQNYIKKVLEIQGDKHAMNLLANGEGISNSVRAGLNTTLMNVYKKVDENVITRLAEISGIPKERIKVFNASSSSKERLVLGQKTTYDRDITYYFIKDDGSFGYFNEKNTATLYDLEFRRTALELTGDKNAAKHLDTDGLKYSSEKMDQTNIEDIQNNPESYGSEGLNQMINAYHLRENLTDPGKITEAVKFKTQKEFVKFNSLMDEADKLLQQAGEVDPKTAQKLMKDALKIQGEALGCLGEGCRQGVKCFRLFASRMGARADLLGGDVIPEKLYRGVALLDKLPTGQAKPDAVIKSLKDIGYDSIEAVTNEIAGLADLIG